jgi:hypothetical protein
MQRTLVAFESQDVIAALINDLFRKGTLTVHRIKGHHAAFELQ